jgi:hypothetical protein
MVLRGLIAAAVAVGLVPPFLAQAATPAGAQPPAATQTPAATAAPADAPAPAAATVPYESSRSHFAVALPAGCRHDEGPGTIDAVCAPDFDAGKSAAAASAAALVLSVVAQPVPADADTSIAGLRQRYGEVAFRDGLPEAVCGEADKARVRIENFSDAVDGNRLVYSADVVCAPVRFLQIGERHAKVRDVMTPDMHYRVLARAQDAAFAKQRATVDAFLASFRALPGGSTDSKADKAVSAEKGGSRTP